MNINWVNAFPHVHQISMIQHSTVNKRCLEGAEFQHLFEYNECSTLLLPSSLQAIVGLEILNPPSH